LRAAVLGATDFLVFEGIAGVLAGEGVAPDVAVPILTVVWSELARGDDIPLLYLCRIEDTAGASHIVVTRNPSPSARPMIRFHIELMSKEARKELAARYEAELTHAN